MNAGFFVDENDLALGKALAEQREGVLYPGHPDLPDVPRGTQDDEWLEVIGEQGLAVITRDKRIRYRPVEKLRWVEHEVRGFVLTGKSSQSTAESLTILEKHWADIEELVTTDQQGPWMYAVTDARVRRIEVRPRRHPR